VTLVWLEDLRLNAELAGPANAPPVVLIHGLGVDLRVWEALLPALARHRVLRLDLRGHGNSDTPAPPLTMGTLIRDVERLMVHFSMKDAVVVGSGEGGLIAQGLAVKRLDLVRAMVLTGSATRFANPSVWESRLARLKADGPDIDAECAHLLGPRWRTSPALPQVQEMLTRTRADGWQGVASATATADFYQPTATLTLPTLILAGSDDRKVPPDLQRELADLIAGSQMDLLSGGTHISMLSHAVQFSDSLTAFLTRIGHV
jgi:3-oxoadipate enol-lactonase